MNKSSGRDWINFGIECLEESLKDVSTKSDKSTTSMVTETQSSCELDEKTQAVIKTPEATIQ